MVLPIQSKPVIRPELVHPHETIDIMRGTPEQVMRVRLLLLGGANYNDPQYYSAPSYTRMKASGRRSR
ncbi:cyanobactin biosynthesis protein (PatB/AcyB/McaB family) [Rhodovulum sulfidophilum]|uniref:cyanobactin biosynthesis system PatB/AcyB/McaB family protein n=1 Tax=Rhodovulum sulfidophilum TaxID=35806 RepID=UPI0009082F34|nr:cyanobactin biosynthesis protein (PatB/AcyB/McaB family) [Rhodovulum sulfidophilum]